VITAHPATRRLLALLYVVGFLMAADQLADLLTTLLSAPMAPSSAQWRFGVFGLFATRVGVFLVAEVLLFTAALTLEHRTALRLLGALNLLLALALLAGFGVFALDTLELRRAVGAAAAGLYESAALRAGVVSLIGVGLLGWSGWIAARPARDDAGRRRDGASLIVDVRGPRGDPS
jgi:hypothetical protein